MPTRFAVVAALATLSLPAQTVTITLSTPTGLDAAATVGTQTVTQSIPAGNLAPSGYRLAQSSIPGIGNSSCSLSWATTPFFAPLALARCEFTQQAVVAAPAPSQASTNLSDILMHVQASSPITVNLELWRLVQGTLGASIPTSRIDVGADGTFEMVETSPQTVNVWSVTLGPQPLPILVRTQTSLAIPGSLTLRTSVTMTLDNDLTIAPILAGCNGDVLFAWPSLVGRGIGLESNPSFGNDPAVAVFGFGMQPIMLPFGPTCLLMPSADFLMPLPPFQAVDIPLPAAVRPVAFWLQSVVLSPLGLTTATAHFVVAD